MSLREIFNSNISLFRYLLVGFVAFTVDYVLLLSLYYLIGLNLSLSTTLGYLVGLIVSFSINRLWVFGGKGKERNPFRQMVEYVLLVIINYAFTVIAINLLDDAGIKPSIGKIIIMGLIVIWNYLLFSRLIFNKKTT